jgi:hypothetical protein
MATSFATESNPGNVACNESYESVTILPDGLFSNQKSQFGLILKRLRLENVDIFYGHL